MNDAFDTLITESLHRTAATVPHRGAGFSDVRRRVRRRRQRNVAAMSLPAVLGVAAIGLHTTPRPIGLQAGAADQTTPGTATTSPPATTGPTPTTVFGTSFSGTTTTLPADVIGEVVCLNATGDPSNEFVRGCQLGVGGGKWLMAGKVDAMTFVMALDPIAAAEAATVAATMGIYVRPLDTSYLPTDVDIYHTAAKVVVVVGSGPPISAMATTSVPASSTTNFAP
jgi:hypothetical protein